MKAVKFTKTFDLPEGGQLAVQRSYDGEIEKHIIVFSALFENDDFEFIVGFQMKFDKAKKRDVVFENYSQQDADKTFNALKKEAEKVLG